MNQKFSSNWPRVIIHADMDAFFAAVAEQDDPSLVGKPVVVGGRSKRSVVSTANYEARKWGLKSAMPMVEALRRCPQVTVVPPNFERYKEVSDKINGVFHHYSPLVEPLSLDEAFLDMTGSTTLLGAPHEIATNLKNDVFDATGGLTVSVGVSTTKYVAKVASDYRKPDGITLVPQDQVISFLSPLDISRLWGAGAVTQKRLRAMGCQTIADVAQADESSMTAAFGMMGEQLVQLARGIDEREVIPEQDPKSIGQEITLEEDIEGREAILSYLDDLAESVARRLRKNGRCAHGVRVKLRTNDFRLWTRQKVLTKPTDSGRVLFDTADSLLELFNNTLPLRLVGITAFKLVDCAAPIQTELFPDPKREKDSCLDRVLDELAIRFGDDVVKRGPKR